MGKWSGGQNFSARSLWVVVVRVAAVRLGLGLTECVRQVSSGRQGNFLTLMMRVRRKKVRKNLRYKVGKSKGAVNWVTVRVSQPTRERMFVSDRVANSLSVAYQSVRRVPQGPTGAPET